MKKILWIACLLFANCAYAQLIPLDSIIKDINKMYPLSAATVPVLIQSNTDSLYRFSSLKMDSSNFTLLSSEKLFIDYAEHTADGKIFLYTCFITKTSANKIEMVIYLSKFDNSKKSRNRALAFGAVGIFAVEVELGCGKQSYKIKEKFY